MNLKRLLGMAVAIQRNLDKATAQLRELTVLIENANAETQALGNAGSSAKRVADGKKSRPSRAERNAAKAAKASSASKPAKPAKHDAKSSAKPVVKSAAKPVVKSAAKPVKAGRKA